MTLLNDFVMVEAEPLKDSDGTPLKIMSSTPFIGKVTLIGGGVKPWHQSHNPDGIRCGNRVLCNGYTVASKEKYIVKHCNIIGIYDEGE